MAVPLIEVETEDFLMTLMGRPPEELLPAQPVFGADVRARTTAEGCPYKMRVYGASEGAGADRFHPPLLFEDESYQLIIERKRDGALGFWHENPSLRKAIRPVGSGKVWSGILNFRGEVGETQLVILWNNRRALTVTVEVFPSKLDYRLDYEAMLREVHTYVRGLVFRILTRTYRKVEGEERPPTEVEWLAKLINHLMADLAKAVTTVSRQPHLTLAVTERWRRLDLVRRPGPSAARWLRSHPDAWTHVWGSNEVSAADGCPYAAAVGSQKPAHTQPLFPEKVKTITYDNPENRFVRYVLEQVLSRLRHLKRQTCQWQHDASSLDELRSVISNLEAQALRLLRLPFLQGLGEWRTEGSLSLVLQFAPGYREVLRAYLALLQGLSIEGRALRIGVCKVHELYEYWCFLRLAQMLAERAELVSQDIVHVRRRGLWLTLQQGEPGTITFRDKLGASITLTYNAYAPWSSVTVPQRPDFLVILDRHMPGCEHRFILDAKYRLDTSAEYVALYGGPGPREEDINAMHRYRDAFLTGEGAYGVYWRDVLGACVLFPWRGDYRHHHFYRSLQLVGIGGLPFLPGETELVSQFLDEFLGLSDREHVERAILPRGHDVWWEWRYRNEPVLVATVPESRQKKRLALIRQYGYYHAPVDELPARYLGFEYVALFYEGAIRYYAKVANVSVVAREELPGINEIPSSRHADPGARYYRIDLDMSTWKETPVPIVKTTGRPLTFLITTLEALLEATTVEELYLRKETERCLLKALHSSGIRFEVLREEERSWEIQLVPDGVRLRPHDREDAINVWLPGGTLPARKIPGHVIREKPGRLLHLIRATTAGVTEGK